jgi:hypothetical protein
MSSFDGKPKATACRIGLRVRLPLDEWKVHRPTGTGMRVSLSGTEANSYNVSGPFQLYVAAFWAASAHLRVQYHGEPQNKYSQCFDWKP